MSDPAKILAMLDAPPPATAVRLRPCRRCETLAALARKAGLPEPPVHEVESWGWLGRRYHAALCRECADWEWSARWQARYEAAAEDLVERQALDCERGVRLARGRRFWPEARLGARSR